MRKGMRKNYHKRMVKMIREENRAIAADNLWKGRFVIVETGESWVPFGDKSGGELRVYLRIIDKKTGYYADYYYDYATSFRNINWGIVNHFITEMSGAWDSNPYADTTDYTKVALPKTKKEKNYYISYKYWKEQQNEQYYN